MIRRVASLVMLVLLAQVGLIEAASLDKETCDKLKSEQSQLEQAGARGNMGKGPDWAKTNLAQDKLDQIKRLIEVEELILFRCQGKPLVVLPAEAELDPAAKEGESKEQGKGPPAKATAATPPGADKKAPTAKKAASPPPKAATGGEAKPKPAASGEAKPKPAASKDAAVKKESAAKEAVPAKSAKEGTGSPAKAAKPKPKTDDAYKPPASDAGADPFAKQLAPAGKN